MYTPKVNSFTNKDEIIAFMLQFSFATIITSKNNLPIATHLPFIINEIHGKIVLSAHFAKANEQWQDIENHPALVIFSEPHAYISTTHYEQASNVPTWNYIAVHAYGSVKILSDKNEIMDLLEASIDKYEASYQQQWTGLSEEYKTRMSQGIIAFQLVVDDLQAKKKLSQNRSKAEQQNIITALSTSPDSNARLIADFMKKEPKNNP